MNHEGCGRELKEEDEDGKRISGWIVWAGMIGLGYFRRVGVG